MSRVYLDWNATAPLRPEAREAMLAAMDAVGNPSSVHSEGRAAKAIVEKARGQVARLVGCEPGEVVFTSGATEAATLVLSSANNVYCGDWEHDCILSWRTKDPNVEQTAPRVGVPEKDDVTATQSANHETGEIWPTGWIEKDVRRGGGAVNSGGGTWLIDAVQSFGKIVYSFHGDFQLLSSHKLGGPKGVGSLIVRSGIEMRPLQRGGGQEMGRRSGTENVIGIAGFGAAAETAQRDLEAGVWDRVAELRNRLEERLLAATPDLIIFGHDVPRLPNTSSFAIPGWKGETQVMQMDLAGFAVSAGSACSSGKVGPSRVLLAMGFDEVTAASAIRVSMGPTTTEAEVMGFADTWIEYYRRRKVRAA